MNEPVARVSTVGIDASNIRQGGGVTHLSQLLSAADPAASGVRRVSVWASRATLEQIPDATWLDKRHSASMEAGLPQRLWWQQTQLSRELTRAGCDLLFSPGATLPSTCPVRMVTMSQNMLPFEPIEAARFGALSAMRLKMRLLRSSQGASFRRANGIIFLTRYARDTVSKALGGLSCPTTLIPHGIEPRFRQGPRPIRPLASCSFENPFRLLYVSIEMPYKHQLELVQAVATLRGDGMPIELTLVGAPFAGYGRQVQALCERLDPSQRFIRRQGALPHAQLHSLYRDADAFVFASSCENLPNILVEAMAAGLPIASSDRGPMPEILGDAGLYFDPDLPDSIAASLRRLAGHEQERARLAEAAWQRAAPFCWKICADDTFTFLASVASPASKPSRGSASRLRPDHTLNP